eukprot:gene58738-80443_t
MLHPIFSTVLGHPELVAEHLANYAALVRQETAQAGRGLVARIVAGVLAAASAMLALGLIGVAVLLGVLHGSFHWVLVAVPGVAVVIAAFCAWYATRPSPSHGFDDLRSQLEADLQQRLALSRRALVRQLNGGGEDAHDAFLNHAPASAADDDLEYAHHDAAQAGHAERHQPNGAGGGVWVPLARSIVQRWWRRHPAH